MADRARTVVVGAGIVGASVAYHLAVLGQGDVLVVDGGDVPDNPGSTSHAPGGVVAMSHDRLLARLSFYSTDLYARLERYDQFRNTYNPTGSIEMAATPDRMDDLVREHGEAMAFGTTTELLDADEIVDRVPFVDPRRIVGGLFIPNSAMVSGVGVTGALLRDAAARGEVRVRTRTKVTAVATADGRVSGVRTAEGEHIEAERVVLCTNIWSLPAVDGVELALPLMAFQHQYVESPPMLDRFATDDPDSEIVYPTVRDMDAGMYYRHHWDRIGVGSYAHRPLAVHPEDVGDTAELAFTPEDFADAWAVATSAIPMLGGVDRFERSLNGMFAFTVDGMPILGETGAAGLWMAIGSWITHAGAVGKAVAELIVDGESEWDLRQASVDRFLPHATTDAFVRAATSKNYREVYDIHHPREAPSEPRGVRLSPFVARLEQFRPHMVPFGGVELAAWYDINLARAVDVPSRSAWASKHWSPAAVAEHIACRERAALFDLTGLSIIEVRGPDAVSFMEHLCANRVDVAPGRVVYTLWLTPGGGVKRDLAVARLGDDRFWAFVGEGTRPQDVAWVCRHAGAYDVTVDDISDAWTALGLWGPATQPILEAATQSDVSKGALGYFRGRWIDIGYARVFAMRISYVGEAGWELHIPVDQATPVFETVWSAGRDHDLVMAGSTAMDSLRIEKGYRLWGTDVHTEHDPYEAGLGWSVRLDRGPFIGADACRARSTGPPTRRLSCLVMETGDPLGNEPVLARGDVVGYVTSAAYGPTLGGTVAYAYVSAESADVGAAVDVVIGGRSHRARIAAEPLWDPDGNRLR